MTSYKHTSCIPPFYSMMYLIMCFNCLSMVLTFSFLAQPNCLQSSKHATRVALQI